MPPPFYALRFRPVRPFVRARRHSPTGLPSTTSCGLPRPADAQRVSLHGAVEGGRVSGRVLEAWASCCPSPRFLKVDYCRWSRHTTVASTASASTKTLRCWPPAARYNAGHCPHTMRNRVYASVGRLSVSVRPSANFAAVARPEGDMDRLLHGTQQRGVRRANVGDWVVPRRQPQFR